MANVIARDARKATTPNVTDEIAMLIDRIRENAKLARQSEKELVALRKRNDRSFAQMKKALDRLSA
jgi:hypothetical protein